MGKVVMPHANSLALERAILFHLAGYGVQTALFAPRIQAQGHDIAISCLWGLEGGVIQWPGPRGTIPCYPKGFALYSQDALPAHAAHFNADLILTLVDAWVMEPDMMAGMPWAAWYPVDMDPVPGPVLEKIRRARFRVAMSRYGVTATEDAGLDALYVPHGYDPKVFTPRDAKKAREYLKAGDDRFVVGVVSANKGTPSRKSFPQIFEAYAAFHKKYPEALLYVHSHMGTEYQGLDLAALGRYYELPDDSVRVADQYQLMCGYPDDFMAQLYSAMDVLLIPSMGEGFGVPLIEAQACGTPVITGDWTAMSELCISGSKISQDEATRFHIPNFADQYLPDTDAITRHLEAALDWDYDPAQVSAGVAEYDADRVAETHWKPVLDEIQAALRPVVNRADRRRAKFKMKDAVA